MNIILKMSVRNLIRQKRRNLLLGLSIAFGMGVLVFANAFGTGITDLILNKMVERISGHILVKMVEKDTKERKVIRDKDRIIQTILENVDGVKAVHEQLTAHGKAIGNGKAMCAAIFGIEPDEVFYRETRVAVGDLRDLSNPAIEHPVALYTVMAEKLNVRLDDVIRLKFQTLYGQVQIARFTVVAIIKADNPFFNSMIYCHLKHLKTLMGYHEHETSGLRVILENIINAQRAIEQADRLHNALHPEAAGYTETLRAGLLEGTVTVLAVMPDEESRHVFASHLQIVDGDPESVFQDEHAIMLSRETAERLHVRVGNEVTSSYHNRFDESTEPQWYRVGAIFDANDVVTKEMVFVHVERLYNTVFSSPPQRMVLISHKTPLFPVLLKEWDLLKRTFNQRESAQKYRELSLSNWQGAILDVQTVHEVVEDALEITSVMTIITFVGVMILFFVIQIGVVNLLRTTIRERTREIGTVRAIGMQRSDVRWCFVTEVLLLTIFAAIIGIVLAVAAMKIFSALPIDTGDSEMGFFLINQHLYFVTRPGDVLKYLVIIAGIAFLTSYFPARNAAKLSIVEALRHYE